MTKKIPNLGKAQQTTESKNKSNSVIPKSKPITLPSNTGDLTEKTATPKIHIPKPKQPKVKKERKKKNKYQRYSSAQKAKLAETRKATTKERQRVKAFIKRAEKRGYNFTDELKSRLSKMTLNELVALQPEVLYELSTTEKFGSLMTGTEARQKERQLAALKAQQTRELKRRKYTGDAYIPEFTDIVLKRVEEMIAEAEALRTQLYALNAMDLHRVLTNEINQYGRDKVALALGNNPDDAIAQAERAIYTSDAKAHREAITAFIMLITGSIPTVDESKEYTKWEDATETYYDNPFMK